eukprot:TRINITY_DN5508_c0_g1_i9.p1 TRINITY_DN5508_c0_g1~~TRINITY_DN5508_c0_g1_i9.p1  ORF type:complete len:151 (-),score=22.14 TRINITY_DN5508_c0_g1_i9:208-660(-)
MFYNPAVPKSSAANVFIKNLDKSINNRILYETFSVFGSILSCEVATDEKGLSKGHGFVEFEREESANKAIEQLNGALMNGKKVYVGLFVQSQERDSINDKNKFNHVYVKNLCEKMTEEDLKEIFGNYGSNTSVVVIKDVEYAVVGKCKGF